MSYESVSLDYQGWLFDLVGQVPTKNNREFVQAAVDSCAQQQFLRMVPPELQRFYHGGATGRADCVHVFAVERKDDCDDLRIYGSGVQHAIWHLCQKVCNTLSAKIRRWAEDAMQDAREDRRPGEPKPMVAAVSFGLPHVEVRRTVYVLESEITLRAQRVPLPWATVEPYLVDLLDQDPDNPLHYLYAGKG